MNSAPIIFVVPTYRLRDVAETMEKYDEHFCSNGHSVRMIVFDDSSLANHEKYYSLPEQTRTVNEIFYFHKDKKDFPRIRVKNKRLKTRNGEPASRG